MFQSDQKRFYVEINNGLESKVDKVIPDADESIKFWSEIWDNGIEHNKDSEWLHEMKQGIGYLNQNDLKINKEDITKQIAEQLDEILNGKAELPQWITYGRTVLCLKDPSRGNAVDNFRPISCLPLMWKLMTGVIAESMYTFLEINDVLLNEQKGCRRKTRGTKDQLIKTGAEIKTEWQKQNHGDEYLGCCAAEVRSWCFEMVKR
ncbi:Hypothetical predicted protein [Paramuricea clavata]|uniref:Uncharacterized protein n=1 Tax=Paramuricea clavata TaxID=317549 RepID=A0A7D9J0W9_PARCT|nr:Hypothetical predicted protein [Paramuricea clavata]